MYDIYIIDISCIEQKILPTTRPDIPAPVKNYNEYDIPGRDGKLYEDLGTYDDIEITLTFNYMCAPDQWHDTFRKCKKMFLDAKTLEFSDDNEFYHRVKKAVINTNERVSKRIGKFSVGVTLDPYYYSVSGKYKYPYKKVLYNGYERTRPLYFITGEGVCHLEINGTDIKCNIGQNLVIDTFLKISYRSDGTLQNTAVSGDYEDMQLKEGMNEISITDGFERSRRTPVSLI